MFKLQSGVTAVCSNDVVLLLYVLCCLLCVWGMVDFSPSFVKWGLCSF